VADKWICLDCRFIGGIDEFDRVRDPVGLGEWTVCPLCRTPEQVTSACDEEGCTREGDCGFPVEDERRYRRTCFEHSIFNKERMQHDRQTQR
jgi:hypothetical protein